MRRKGEGREGRTQRKRGRRTEEGGGVLWNAAQVFQSARGGALSGMTECLADPAGKPTKMRGWDGCRGARAGRR